MRVSIHHWALLRCCRGMALAAALATGMSLTPATAWSQTGASRFQEFRIATESVDQARQRVLARLAPNLAVLEREDAEKVIAALEANGLHPKVMR